MLPIPMKVVTQALQKNGQSITALRRGTTLWYVVRSLGEQVVLALDDLGYVRTDALGQTQGFKVKELAVTPDGQLAMVHLDVTSVRLFQPAAPKSSRGKPVPYLSLIHDKVLEQIRVRVSELLGGRVDVWADNHYYVRYLVNLKELDRSETFPSADLTAHLDDVPGPFTIPLGLDRDGAPVWVDLVETARHLLLTGTSGGGKTTWMDAAACALAQHTPPDRLKLVFLDPQRLNFSPYEALADYRFTDREGQLGVVWQPEEIVSAVARLNREHLRRVQRVGDTPWGSIEGYNAHVTPEERLPYVFLFADELALLHEALKGMGRGPVRAFQSALNSLIVGGRKVGFRLILCLQYLKSSTLPAEIAAQAALQLAFWNSPQGSKNSLGDTSAALLPGEGRFIVDGLPASRPSSNEAGMPGGRRVLQGLYVDRETVLELVSAGPGRRTYPVDSLVLDLITYALQEMEGDLSLNKLNAVFGHLMSRRQVDNLLSALEQVDLALPSDRSTVPPRPRRLRVRSVEEAIEVLQYHPEICFRKEEGAEGLLFGPPGVP